MKRIYRDERNGKIAGICAGLGEILDVDPTIVRLVVVFLTVITAFWPGILTYIIGWVVIPEKREIVKE